MNSGPDANSTFIDPNALMRIKNLELRSKVVVEGFFSGLHRSPYHGFSVEFSEYRQYTPGDDLRYLDWRLYARTDRHYIKRFEDETNLRCYLLVDLSKSMSYGSLDHSKADYAKTAAATIAYFLTIQRDAVGLLTFDEKLEDYLPARHRPGHMHRIMLSLERSPAGTATNIERPLEQIAQTVSKRGLIVLISDLLTPIDTLERYLGYLRSRGHEVVILRVLDPAELDFTFDQPAMFHDLESGRKLYIDPAATREKYQQRFADHESQLARICANLGVDQFRLATNEPLELALFDYLSARLRRGRAPSHRSATAASGASQ